MKMGCDSDPDEPIAEKRKSRFIGELSSKIVD